QNTGSRRRGNQEHREDSKTSPKRGNEAMKRHFAIAASFVAVLIVLAGGMVVFDQRAAVGAAGVQAPPVEVDPMWPNPLPSHWVLGWATGVTVDPQDHIWIVQQANKLSPGELFGEANVSGSCCFAAPPVLEFDQAGNLVGHWGGPGKGYDWVDSPH